MCMTGTHAFKVELSGTLKGSNRMLHVCGGCTTQLGREEDPLTAAFFLSSWLTEHKRAAQKK